MAKSIQEMDIFERIVAISSELGTVKKDGKVAFNKTNYSYTSEAGFLAALKPLMSRYHVMLYPAKTDYLAPVNGVAQILVSYVFVAAGYNGEGDKSIIVQVGGQGADSTDKGMPKAFTSALKYALRQTFLVSTGDDAEATDANGNKTSGIKTPFENLRAKLSKAKIVVQNPYKGIDEAVKAFPTADRLTFIGRSLACILVTLGIDINSDAHDTQEYANAIAKYVATANKATTPDQIADALDALVADLS